MVRGSLGMGGGRVGRCASFSMSLVKVSSLAESHKTHCPLVFSLLKKGL